MTFDRVLEPLARLVRALTARIDYLALYPARVVAQNSDGTLELQPDDVRMPSLSQVPIRYGIPGVRATVAAGARVLLGFEGGDPSRPVATLWEAASVTRLEIDAGDIILNGGSHEVARKSDSVAIGYLTGSNAGGPVVFALTSSPPVTPPGDPPPAPGVVIQLSGTISAGAAHVKA